MYRVYRYHEFALRLHAPMSLAHASDRVRSVTAVSLFSHGGPPPVQRGAGGVCSYLSGPPVQATDSARGVCHGSRGVHDAAAAHFSPRPPRAPAALKVAFVCTYLTPLWVLFALAHTLPSMCCHTDEQVIQWSSCTSLCVAMLYTFRPVSQWLHTSGGAPCTVPWGVAHTAMLASCRGGGPGGQWGGLVLVSCMVWACTLVSVGMLFQGVYARLLAVFVTCMNLLLLLLCYAARWEQREWPIATYFFLSSLLLVVGVSKN